MNDFLMILIDAMKSVDGNKDSLLVAEKHIIKQKQRLHNLIKMGKIKDTEYITKKFKDWNRVTKQEHI